jgi:polyisoprenoid-binding protein YceI
MAVEIRPTRVVNGRDVPAAGLWEFDQGHTEVLFEGRHLMVSRIRGRFEKFSGRLWVVEAPEESSAELVIEAASVESGFKDRDDHIRSADWFDVERYPLIGFKSTGLTHLAADRWRAGGQLTIRDLTRPVELEVEFGGGVLDPWGGARIGFTATTVVDREDWGLTWNLVLETGGLVASKKIALTVNVEAVLRTGNPLPDPPGKETARGRET